MHCPVCGREFEAEQSAFLPFCGERCKLVDLHRWLGERYGLPYEGAEEDLPPSGDVDEEG
jgi:uncharacterized protein